MTGSDGIFEDKECFGHVKLHKKRYNHNWSYLYKILELLPVG
ncbi:hypothetical protein HMPREF9431_00877 [Segatella oulorum F0390]|uniref:Uncharacterized protein n=1 Tax=Segatella oulorum F0390 TaxID=702438 RepID=G1WAM6_9BACT|nr:hypothetical protein HMPREF9431_00877 [Segatella oulorum F0390]